VDKAVVYGNVSRSCEDEEGRKMGWGRIEGEIMMDYQLLGPQITDRRALGCNYIASLTLAVLRYE
jgi:hypothetical protein